MRGFFERHHYLIQHRLRRAQLVWDMALLTRASTPASTSESLKGTLRRIGVQLPGSQSVPEIAAVMPLGGAPAPLWIEILQGLQGVEVQVFFGIFS